MKCKAFRKKKSQKGEKPQGDTTHNLGEEAHVLIGVWDSDYTEPAEARGISTSDSMSGEPYPATEIMQGVVETCP